MTEKEYIERELAEKTIDRFEGYLDDDMIFRIKYALRKHIPAADVAPVKHGHWVSNTHTDTAICSECKGVFTDETNFCPNCGAKNGR